MKARSACVSGNARSAVSYPEEPFSVTDEMYGADPDSTSISGQRGATLRPPSVKLCKDRDQQTVARIAWDIVPGHAHWSALTRSRRAGLIESGSRRQFDASGGCFTKEFDFQGAHCGQCMEDCLAAPSTSTRLPSCLTPPTQPIGIWQIEEGAAFFRSPKTNNIPNQ
jgi:hypothetical protein